MRHQSHLRRARRRSRTFRRPRHDGRYRRLPGLAGATGPRSRFPSVVVGDDADALRVEDRGAGHAGDVDLETLAAFISGIAVDRHREGLAGLARWNYLAAG